MKNYIIIIALIFTANIASASNFSRGKGELGEQLFAQISATEAGVELVQVPVLKTRMDADAVISEADIAYIELDSRRAKNGYILDATQLIGKSPTRSIAANRPIREAQIKAQTLVHDKKSVTIYFKNKFIQMQDMGIAMEDGAEGDYIRVKNATSNIMIRGKVVGENLVEVAPQGAILARN